MIDFLKRTSRVERIVILCLSLLLLTIPAKLIIARATSDYQVITVTDKNINIKGNAESGIKHVYMIFSEEGVYQNTDTIAYFKYNSSYVYSKLKIGETYNCLVYGFRVPFLSMYKNIVSCELIGE